MSACPSVCVRAYVCRSACLVACVCADMREEPGTHRGVLFADTRRWREGQEFIDLQRGQRCISIHVIRR